MTPKTDRQRANLRAILLRGRALVEQIKQEALKEQDYDQFFRTAENWRQLEKRFKEELKA